MPHHWWSFRSTLEGYRGIMIKHGDSDKRLWVTEFGWASRTANLPGLGICPGQQSGRTSAVHRKTIRTARDWGWVGPMFIRY